MTQVTCETRVRSDSQGSDRGRILELVESLRNLLRAVSELLAFTNQPPTERLNQHNDFNIPWRSVYRRVRICVSLHCSGGAVMEREYVIQATPGRDGWVYLIHAQGTDRYKVGRSNNPVVRHQILQKQSPYPLEIINSFWSVDAINDEAAIHENFAAERVYGEWFDFPRNEENFVRALVSLKQRFLYPSWISISIMDHLDEIFDFLLIHNLGSKQERYELSHHLSHLAYEAYSNINSQAKYIDIQAAFKESISRIKQFSRSRFEPSTLSGYDEIRFFAIGVIAGLAIALGRQGTVT